MQHETAVRLITTTFDQPLDEEKFAFFAANLVNDIDTTKAIASRHGKYIPQPFQGHVRQYKRPFVYYDPHGERLDVLLVRLQSARSLDRARTMQRNFAAWYLKQTHSEPVEAALIAFYHDDVPDWRFSFVRLEYAFGDEGLEEKLTPARRYSFLVGPNEPTHTAEQQLLPLLRRDDKNPTIDDIAHAFRVEVVSRQFFEQYKELFLRLVEALETAQMQDAQVRRDFERAGVHLPSFAKKLLGQIVFLYFVQKKGWLGVEPGQKWGSGPRDFLRRLFDKQNGVVYDNFFDDVLEPLFYRALAVQRPDDAFAIGGYRCQIPFLNGGLFEPMGNYDWQNTRLLLPNALFSDRRSAGDDQGSGILDVFDRYNFTVWEEEPLEKEVAVDPEMLGKVFENLLEVQDRKSKGAFYTPREIVHYMCQESLINYLHTQIGPISETSSPGEAAPQIGPISRDDIAVLVRQGALALQQDAAKEAGLQKGEYVLPESVRNRAAALDAALAEIKLCDPAIGSGAFPVGMLHEIVQARQALTTYLDDSPAIHGRDAYALKRHAIQESIYGVDIDAGAVEIAKLRLWLSLVVDEENYADIQPLPNLDYKIVQGNSLLGVDVQPDLFNNRLFVQLEQLKQRFFAETHRYEKQTLRAQIDLLLEQLAGKKDVFDFNIFFHEVFDHKDGFDVVIGNPPYGYHQIHTESQKRYYKKNYISSKGSFEQYFLFYEKGLILLNNTGNLHFITPLTWLTIPSALSLRKFILSNFFLKEICWFSDKVFEQASVNTATSLIQRKVLEKAEIKIYESLREFPTKPHKRRIAKLAHFVKNDYYISIFEDQKDTDLLEKISSVSLPLETYARPCSGYNPYERGKGEAPEGGPHTKETVKSKPYHAEEKLGPEWRPELVGKNLSRFHYEYLGDRWVKYGPWLAAPRDQENFLGKRILVQEITGGNGKRIVAAYVEEEIYYSRDIIPIKIERDFPSPLFLLGLINSRLLTWYHQKRNPKAQKNLFPKVLVSDLKKLPIRKMEAYESNTLKIHDDIVDVVKEIIKTKNSKPLFDTSFLDQHLDELVYQLYDLTPEEIQLIEDSVRV